MISHLPNADRSRRFTAALERLSPFDRHHPAADLVVIPAAHSQRCQVFDRVVASLAGVWLLRRSIDNGVSMIGTATIAPRGDGQSDYHECGRLILANGQVIEGERRYIFEGCSDGFAVLFAESPPRPFHRIGLSQIGASLVGSGVHLCGEDRYDSRYEFRADDTFVVAHEVRGPHKRYTIETHYSHDGREF